MTEVLHRCTSRYPLATFLVTFLAIYAGVFVLTAECARLSAAEGQKRHSRRSRQESTEEQARPSDGQNWGDANQGWDDTEDFTPSPDDNFGDSEDGAFLPDAPSEEPDDPGDWGAPGHPDSPENFGWQSSDEFSPGEESGESFLQQYEAAAGDEPIELGGDGQFITDDRVQLAGVFFKGGASKDTVPVILVHDKKQSADDLLDLAKQFAAEGMAVLVPDLRGHGESITSWVYDFSEGGNRPAIRKKDDYVAESFSENDFEAMRFYDGILWYRFLMVLHNAEKLNLRRLVVVGFGFGAQVSGSWIVNDWQQSSAKKGRFAKCFVAISPDTDDVFTQIGTLKGKPALASLLIVGSLDKRSLDASRDVQCRLGHEKPTIPEEDRKIKLISIKTEKESTELVSLPAYGVFDSIKTFLEENKGKTSPTLLKWAPIKLEQ